MSTFCHHLASLSFFFALSSEIRHQTDISIRNGKLIQFLQLKIVWKWRHKNINCFCISSAVFPNESTFSEATKSHRELGSNFVFDVVKVLCAIRKLHLLWNALKFDAREILLARVKQEIRFKENLIKTVRRAAATMNLYTYQRTSVICVCILVRNNIPPELNTLT